INVVPGPKIIIAGSGMMTGGRVHHHLKRVLPDPRSIFLVVGYQAEGTLGREIQSEKEAVYIDGKRVPVRCRIESMGAYSAHADKKKLLEWFEKFDPTPRNVFITHADPVAAASFSETLKEKYNTTVTVAKMNETATI
ncbi:MAG TPA: MBL fold metallo-hydrolase RNA specificity domain-containing protein, partial [bacterium]|nr:MBL fold metallo-hydrolase RNA specificity domain-containing protein [bacterium]